MTTNLQFNADSKSNLTNYTTAGQVIFTEDNLYLVKTDGSKIKYSSIEVVPSLPSSNISSNKIYILPDFSMNYYDSSWHKLNEKQIVIGTTNTDTTKLWLDTTSTPILKYHNGTSWVNISGSSQIQSDWSQSDNSKIDYIKNKPTISGSNTGDETTSTIKTKLGQANSTTDGYLSSTDWNTFNNKANTSAIPTKTSTLTNDSSFITPNNIKAGTNINLSTSGNDVTINVTGSNATSINNIIVDDSARTNGTGLFYNSTTGKYENAKVNITGIVGSSQITTIDNTTIASGAEATFNHPNSTNIVVSIEEQIAGSSVTDTHIDFSDSSKYTLQDSGKILVGNNKAQLDVYTKLLMHMDDSLFTDVCGHTITNTGVTLDTTNKVFGIGSAYFNGSSSLSIPYSSEWNLGSNNFALKARIKTNSTKGDIISAFNTTSPFPGFMLSIGFITNGKISFFGANSSTSITLTSNAYVNDNNWHHIEVNRNGNVLYLFIDGVLDNQSAINITLTGSNSTIYIGRDCNVTPTRYLTGNIDELSIRNGISEHTTNFIPTTQSFGTPYLTTNTPLYLKTTGLSNFSLTTIDTITSLTIPVTLPSANTTCKILTSFDNGVNWLYRSSGVWYKYTGDLTTNWASSNLNTDLQTYFANLSITTLTGDLSSLGITPISLDFAFQLNSSSSLSETPSVSAITMVYINKAHNEFASYGNYSSSNVEFGVKRISNSSIGVKNLQSTSKTIKVNIVTSV